MSWNAALLVGALLAQFALTAALYIRLYQARTAAVRRGEATASDWLVPSGEPAEIAKVSRSVSSQFELPVLFYVLVLALLAVAEPTLLDASLAWAFVASRVVHAWIHVTGDDVRRRSHAFIAGFLIVIVMAVRLATVVMLGAQGTA